MIIVHCNPELPGSHNLPISVSQVAGTTDTHHQTWLIFLFLVEMRSHYASQADLKFLASNYLSASASQVV